MPSIDAPLGSSVAPSVAADLRDTPLVNATRGVAMPEACRAARPCSDARACAGGAYTAAAASSPWRKEYTVRPPACLVERSLSLCETSPKAIIWWPNAYFSKRTAR